MSPASLSWLLAHEVRLGLRLLSGRRRQVIAFALLFLLLFAGSVPFVQMVRAHPLTASPTFNLMAALAGLFTVTLFVSQSLSMIVMAFFDRGDLDLLLAAPVPPRRVLFVRCLTIAIAPALLYAALISPLLLPMILFADPRLVSIYGVLVGLMLIGAAIGLVLAMGLFAVFGPRRTKTLGQIAAAFMGAAVFLLFQIPNVAASGLSLKARIGDAAGWFAAAPPSWIGRAVLGEPLPLLAIVVAGAVAFCAAAWACGPAFARTAAAAVGAGPRVRRAGRVRFAGGPQRALIRKEMTLIARDPALISQVLLRCLYFVPLALVLMRDAAKNGADVLVIGSVGSVVLFASQIAGSLAWIAISAEEAPDLVACAPVARAAVRRAKLAAALLPVGLLAAIPIGVLLALRPWAGAMTALFGTLACLAAAYVNLWYEKPQKRSAFARRGQGSLIANLGEVFVGFAFVPVTVLAALGTPWALPFALLPVALLGGLYLGRHRDGG